jgi:hypothetical protein
MWKSALACFAAGSVAGAIAFIDDTRVTIAEALFVIFFLAGMALIAFGGSRYRAGRGSRRNIVFGRKA